MQAAPSRVDWLGRNRPCLTYGLRGMSYFTIEISGPSRDLHSGLYGGAVHEPMTDLVHVMSKLVTPKGEILVPGIKEMVAPMTEAESQTYAGIDFCIKDFQAAFGGTNNIFDDEASTLQARWRNPSLSLHGIQGAFYGPGTKTVIPAKVIGKFSIRYAAWPRGAPRMADPLLSAAPCPTWSRSRSPRSLSTIATRSLASSTRATRWSRSASTRAAGGSPTLTTSTMVRAAPPPACAACHLTLSAVVAAATRAIKHVFGSKPDFTREGGSIPVTLTLQEELKTSVRRMCA